MALTFTQTQAANWAAFHGGFSHSPLSEEEEAMVSAIAPVYPIVGVNLGRRNHPKHSPRKAPKRAKPPQKGKPKRRGDEEK